ncbi:hypothetical protein EVAR_67635_1 [Eumeta japonica]|uniref:Uncharacterized protein n=1 Tax=Eumeta variegata TaxID=151549 RepID=A0A4C2AAT7_EUMVA|nr:hypothetical protein EVAR_67635_1 [Eumeta japonica]
MNLQNEWNKFRTSIEALNKIKIDRFVLKPKEAITTQLHTFVDASERAYGAAIYIRSTYKDKTITTRLICSKSRVAPIKKQTLPRLELCAAVLGVELTNRVKQDLHLQDTANFFWSDSKIVLAWINSPAASFHTFVANRIAKIQELSDSVQWRHVRSKENPADAISRGLAPERLQQHSIWFYGPLFLSGNWTNLPPPVFDVHCSEERKKAKQVLTISTSPPNHENVISRINHRNSFKTLQHTIGYILRFITNSKTSKFCRTTNRALDAHEMEEAMNIIIKIVQAAVFEEELERLSLKSIPWMNAR